MSKKVDKETIAKEICKAAKLYKEHLVGRRFLYGIGQDLSNDMTFIHMVSIIQEGGSTSDPQL